MRDPRRIAAAVFSIIVLVAILPVAARNLAPADYLDMEQVADPQLSPDGTQVIYTRRWVDTMADDWASSLWIMNADGSTPSLPGRRLRRALVAGRHRIAYLDEGEPEGTQIFVRWMDARGRDVADHARHRSAGQPALVAGRTHARLHDARADEGLVEDRHARRRPRAPKWTKAPRLVEHMHYRQDRQRLPRRRLRCICSSCRPTAARRAQLTEGDVERGRAHLRHRRTT